MCGAILIGVAIEVAICFIVVKLFKRVPVEHQKQNPNLVWLMLIPLFGLIWSFFVYPKLSAIVQAWAKAVGKTEIGTAGGGLALALCICMCACIIPYVNSCASLAALIILIIYLVQMNGLAEKIAGAPPALPPTTTA